MTGRISRAQMFMGMARIASQRSTCHRLNVGSMVTQANNPVAVGWAGHAPGQPHCPGNTCPGIVPGNCPTTHSEINALRKASLLSPGAHVDLYSTHSPCRNCCDFIVHGVNLVVRRIFFEIPYRDTSHLGMFFTGENSLLTEVYEVTPAGYVVEYFSRKVVELPQ